MQRTAPKINMLHPQPPPEDIISTGTTKKPFTLHVLLIDLDLTLLLEKLKRLRDHRILFITKVVLPAGSQRVSAGYE